MTTTIFLHRFDAKMIDTGYLYKLDDFDWRKRAIGCSSFLVSPKHNILYVARTTLTEANMVDK